MRLRKRPSTTLEQAYKNLLKSPLPQYRNADQEDDPDFRDFIESVSVSKEELAALVSTPELSSIYEAKKYVQDGKRTKRSERDSRPKTLLQILRLVLNPKSPQH